MLDRYRTSLVFSVYGILGDKFCFDTCPPCLPRIPHGRAFFIPANSGSRLGPVADSQDQTYPINELNPIPEVRWLRARFNRARQWAQLGLRQKSRSIKLPEFIHRSRIFLLKESCEWETGQKINCI